MATDAVTFRHRQPVAVHRRLAGRTEDGRIGWWDDWSELATIRATKRDVNGYCGYWTVQFADGGRLAVHQDRLRAL